MRSSATSPTARSPAPTAPRSTAASPSGSSRLGRPEDHAEMLAHHWRSALELARASGGRRRRLAERARLALRDAGDRAFALNNYPAPASLLRGRSRPLAEDDRRPICSSGGRGRSTSRYDERRRAGARGSPRRASRSGRRGDRGRGRGVPGAGRWYRGQARRSPAALSRGPSARRRPRCLGSESTRPRAVSARVSDARGRRGGDSIAASRRSRSRRTLGLDELRAHALTTIGLAKNRIDWRTGSAESRRHSRSPSTSTRRSRRRSLNNLAVLAISRRTSSARDELYTEARATRTSASVTGQRSASFARTDLHSIVRAGRLGRGTGGRRRVHRRVRPSSPHYEEAIVRERPRASIRLARGDSDGALADHRRGARARPESQGPPSRLLPLARALSASRASGAASEEARRLAEETAAGTPESIELAGARASSSVVADELGFRDELERFVEPRSRGPVDRT